MGKWTQGPWRAEASDYEGCLQIISADRKRPITEIWGDGDDDEANARLIAAAPELVEALRTARDYVFSELETERQQMKGYERISRIDEIASDLAEIDAALAKAGVL